MAVGSDGWGAEEDELRMFRCLRRERSTSEKTRKKKIEIEDQKRQVMMLRGHTGSGLLTFREGKEENSNNNSKNIYIFFLFK